MINLQQLFAPRNRGLLLDLSVFVCQLLLINLLTSFALQFVAQAEQSTFAKSAISIFLLGLFVLQPLGPVLKRWSFHQRHESFGTDQSALMGLILSFYKFFYIGAMWIMIFAAFLYFSEAFPDLHAEQAEKVMVAAALVLPVLTGVVIFRYFDKPRKPPRWKFLMSSKAEALGDVCMFLNVICFQLLFSVYVSSPHFLNALHKITRLSSIDWRYLPAVDTPTTSLASLSATSLSPVLQMFIGNINAMTGRLYFAAIAVLLAYFPPRIFYLVVDQHRKITWLMILLANLPLIWSIVFYVPPQKRAIILRQPEYTITSAQLHEEYLADYQAGMRKYRGQYVNITGVVQTRFFPRSLELDDEIGLDGKDGYPWVYCSFDEDQVETAESLETGQLVTFQCVGADNWSTAPRFQHCLVVN